ncbi:MAG TPA: transposase [Planctomycetaceae bacterium]|nr:transposase [Planctomycetaceae bacterium]
MMPDAMTYFITWTTYGTWLPGDHRGWRKSSEGNRIPQPFLEDWCRGRLSETPLVMNDTQRSKVDTVCHEHARFRGWELHAVNVRTNHVHVVVTADRDPKVVRDQFKANATRVLRTAPDQVLQDRIWTRGGDCEIVDSEDELEQVVQYVLEAQDRMH